MTNAVICHPERCGREALLEQSENLRLAFEILQSLRSFRMTDDVVLFFEFWDVFEICNLKFEIPVSVWKQVWGLPL